MRGCDHGDERGEAEQEGGGNIEQRVARIKAEGAPVHTLAQASGCGYG